MANLEWPGRNPVGERFAIGPDFKRVFTVAGVAGDTRGQNDLDKAYAPDLCFAVAIPVARNDDSRANSIARSLRG